MIPVRAIDDGRAPALGFLVAHNVDLLESGLRTTTTDLVIGDDLVIDVLAHDVEGRPVLVLVEDGPGEALFQRAATAVLEFRRAARLFHALNPERGFDVHDTPRLLLVARRLAERTEALLALLKIPSLKTFECTVVDSTTGFQLVVTSRSASPVRAFPGVRKDGDEAHHALSAASMRAGFTPEKNGKKAATPRAKVTRSLFDDMKERLLRLSPDVLEEQDGDVVCFRIADNLLAQITRTDDALLVSTGAEPWTVENEEAVAQAMDAVFRHFFNLQSTRRRMASLESRGPALEVVERTTQQVMTHGDGDDGRQVASG
ncbi:MAG: hypothetical protein IPH13_10270 [Planctomycetes bacterium]|nr:hypothetical protein [Planctomycetota bacterium]